MREIKFRIFNVVTKKMSETFTLEDFAYDQDSEMGRGDFSLNSCDKDYKEHDNILMQYTGLKDKNGKEIYEVDILNTPAGAGTVYWDAGVVLLEWPNDGGSTTLFDTQVGHREVIGNIYENPDLIAS